MTYEIFASPVHRPASSAPDDSGPRPIDFHRLMPGYARTPLVEAPGIARALGVARVFVKDESSRLGLPSFKMLGASWATVQAIGREWLGRPDEIIPLDEVRDAIPDRESRGLAAATDGNHGRGVARMARLLGLRCAIFVPEGTAASRIADIEAEGASCEIVAGTYDDAIARSAIEASENTIVVSDTSWDGYVVIPASVIRGYSTMFLEIDEAVHEHGLPAPTVVAFQAGVGSFAAAGLSHYRADSNRDEPTTVIVEPTRANCLMVSARAGALATAPGPHPSTMAGLNCGLPSMLAWPTVYAATDVYLAIDDDAAHRGMRMLAEAGIVAGESGAASLGALLEIADGPHLDRQKVGLSTDAVVLIVNTEGATDPVNYLAQVGTSDEAVASESAERRKKAHASLR